MKRLLGLGVSVVLLAVILSVVDRAQLTAYVRETDWTLFAFAIALFIPQVAVQALRWQAICRPFASIPYGEAASLILASQSLNVVLPSKAGDLAKAAFLYRQGALGLVAAANLVIYEKLLDVAMLAGIMLAGLAVIAIAGTELAPAVRAALPVAAGLGLAAITIVAILYGRILPPGLLARVLDRAGSRLPSRVRILIHGSTETMETLRARGARQSSILFLTAGIWALHLLQIALFFLSLSVHPTPGEFLSLVPFALFIGLLPSIAGIGVRDAALVLLFPAFPQAAILGVSFYIHLRYVVPALAGLPFFGRYLSMSSAAKSAEQ